MDLASTNDQPTLAYKTHLAPLYRKSNPLKSASFYEELLSSSAPEYKQSYLSELISIYKQENLPAEELSAYQRLLPLIPSQNSPGIWSEIVRLKEVLADIPGQIEAWEGLAQTLPDGPQKTAAFKRLAYLLYQEKDYPRAEKAFLEAAKLDDSDFSLFLNLSRLYLTTGDRDNYKNYLEKTLALKDNPELLRELALAQEEDNLPEKALATWLILAESNPSPDIQSDQPNSPNDPNHQSDQNSPNNPKTQDPQNSDAQFTVIKTNLTEEAKLSVLKLLRPPEGEISKEFEDKLYRYSTNGVEFYNLGVTHFKKANFDSAQKAFLKTLNLDNEGQLKADTRGYLLAVYKEKGQNSQMLEQASLLYLDFPEKKEYRDLVIAHLEAEKNWKDLSQAASNWCKNLPTDPDNWRFLALAQNNMGQPQEAANSLLKAAESGTPNAQSWLLAAEALEKIGDKENSKRAYEKVVELDSANEKAESALLRMALDSLSATKSKAKPKP
jgi:tetratricopeptide (TPR) repeat protein